VVVLQTEVEEVALLVVVAFSCARERSSMRRTGGGREGDSFSVLVAFLVGERDPGLLLREGVREVDFTSTVFEEFPTLRQNWFSCNPAAEKASEMFTPVTVDVDRLFPEVIVLPIKELIES